MPDYSLISAIALPILGVGLGFILTLIFKPSINLGVKLLLSFSGAFLLGIILFEFLPDVYAESPADTGLYIALGLLLQLLLEFGSKGAEHGHIHQKGEIKFPWWLFVSLAIHAFIEGIPIGENKTLLYGIFIHKIPIALIISSFLTASKMPRWKIAAFLIGFALMTPLGALAKNLIPDIETYSTQINAFVVGILLHVSTTILFETSKNHQFNASKFGVILLGFLLSYLL